MKVRGARANDLRAPEKIFDPRNCRHVGKVLHRVRSCSHRSQAGCRSPYPPIFMAAYTAAEMMRVGDHLNGWNPAASLVRWRRCLARSTMAKDVVAMQLQLISARQPRDYREAHAKRGRLRRLRARSLDQIREDIAASEKIGADQLVSRSRLHRGTGLKKIVRLDEFRPV